MSNKKRSPGRPAKYPPEFQRDAVAMVLDEGRSIADVARSIGVIGARWGTGSAGPAGNVPPVKASPPMSVSRTSGRVRRTRSCGWSAIC